MNFADKVRKTMAAKGQAPVVGKVPGKTPSNPKKDNKTIRAQSGEYVIPASVVQAHGKGYFDNLVQNTLGSTKVPAGSPATGYWQGGYVPQGMSQDEPRRQWGGGQPMGMSNQPRGGFWGSPRGEQSNGPRNAGRWNPWGGPGGMSNNRAPWQGGPPQAISGNQDAVDEYPNFWGHQNAGNVFMSPRDWSAGSSDLGHTMYNPFNMFQTMQPGMPWSPTMIPTTYDNQGYPMAVPNNYVTNSSDPTGLLHAGQQLHNR